MTTPALRRKARHYAMQALYQWHMTKFSAADIISQFSADNDMAHVDRDYFRELVNKVIAESADLDEIFSPYLQGKTLAELDAITLALLRVASYELAHRIDIPFKVAISEAVSLGKKFGAEDSHKFINGVLEQVAQQRRQVEMQANSK